ncbi:traB domain-containing protein-like isoform X2 [Mytilus galloprovincialis]|uniref:traB domain-containing protein-like isoform X2 n=1 Tax=Mytilus galloprovincialis TaxID=29158 RepID=UPI003F7C657F
MEEDLERKSKISTNVANSGDMTENEGQLDGSGDHSVNDPQPSGIDSLTDSTAITESTVIIEGPDVSDDEGNYDYSDDFEDDDGEDGSNDGEETDIEDNLEPQFTVCQKADPDLPSTVTVLDTGWGSKVFLIGTAHFSEESQNDVSQVIQRVQPNVVMVELCNSRVNILHLDEETLLEEAKNINFEKIRLSIQQSGLVQGVMHLLLLSMSAHLTKELGMAPGGEFRRAFNEAKLIPGCRLYLGDRPIQITLKRALASLSVWQKLRLAWYLITSKDPISKEEVEKCKQKDLLEQMLKEMTGEFPALSEVFVSERDVFLTHSLKNAALPLRSTEEPHELQPTTVVGVVGIGHMPGIIQNWPKEKHDLREITSIPKGSIVGKLFVWSFRLTFIGVLSYGCFKVYKWTFPYLYLSLSK